MLLVINIVYKSDGTLNLQESYWHYEDGDSLYKSITSTPEFKQAINGFRSEYHFLFDGYNYCKMPLWND